MDGGTKLQVAMKTQNSQKKKKKKKKNPSEVEEGKKKKNLHSDRKYLSSKVMESSKKLKL